MLSLDIGCGESKRRGSIGVDIRRTSGVDVVSDARYLLFRNEVFDSVYSSYLLEHFSHREVQQVVAEWVRVLNKNDVIEIRCPDLRTRALLFFLNSTWYNVKNIYGEQDFPENTHKCGFSYGLLKGLLKSYRLFRILSTLEALKVS